MLHQIQKAINPHISLNETLNSWHEVCEGVAENNRKRRPQMSNFLG
jgi:hypothetical protein